jgi:hypothetical protein
MPPQPLSKVRAKAYPVFGHAAMWMRPQLAVHIAETIAAWAQVEVVLGRVLAVLLGSDASAALAMHATLNGFRARVDSLEAAARSKMPPEDFELFQVTLTAIGKAADRRHEFAHWLWGFCSEVEDALLLIDPRDYWKRVGESQEEAERRQLEAGEPLFLFPPNADLNRVLVYREKDLLEARDGTEHAHLYASRLIGLAVPKFAGHAGARRRLASEPEIRRALDKRRRRGGPLQEVLPPRRHTSDVY